MQQLVVFSLGPEEYGLPITQVHEIIRYQEPRKIPSAYSSVRGVINLRGKIIPVCDVKHRLGLAGYDGAEAKIVIVDAGTGTAGLIVDEVDEVVTVTDEQIVEPELGKGDNMTAIARIGDRLVTLVDASELLAEFQLAA
jgi:purine-binding chemotaxis protein CheW